MSVTTYTHEDTSTVSPNRLFKALVIDGDNLIPKLMPNVKNVETEGDGSIKKINFVEGNIISFYIYHFYYLVNINERSNLIM